MSDFIKRIKTEKIDLDEKRTKLMLFIGSDVFKKLHPEDAKLLADQAKAMCQYSKILSARLDRLECK